MNRKEFEEKNPDLIAFTIGSVSFYGDDSPNLENLIVALKGQIHRKEDMIINLEYSPEREKYFFGIYEKKKE